MTQSRSRLAFTLIEMMVVLSVSATLLVIAVGWIHQSMKVASIMRLRQEHHHNLLRISRQLRDDVHRGDSMAVEDDSRTLVIMLDDRQVTYAILENGVQRLEQQAETIVGQEMFLLARSAFPRWDKSEMPNWISLIVDRGLGTEVAKLSQSDAAALAAETPADLHVRAAIGRWKRLQAAASQPIKELSP